MTVQTILDYLHTLAPAAMKYEWDNVGLICGRRDQEVKKVLVALDPFEHVCQEAAELGADLGTMGFAPLNAFCLMVFCLLYIPCAATIMTIRKESGSWKWTGVCVAFQLGVAWLAAFAIYQIGGLF